MKVEISAPQLLSIVYTKKCRPSIYCDKLHSLSEKEWKRITYMYFQEERLGIFSSGGMESLRAIKSRIRYNKGESFSELMRLKREASVTRLRIHEFIKKRITLQVHDLMLINSDKSVKMANETLSMHFSLRKLEKVFFVFERNMDWLNKFYELDLKIDYLIKDLKKYYIPDDERTKLRYKLYKLKEALQVLPLEDCDALFTQVKVKVDSFFVKPNIINQVALLIS